MFKVVSEFAVVVARCKGSRDVVYVVGEAVECPSQFKIVKNFVTVLTITAMES